MTNLDFEQPVARPKPERYPTRVVDIHNTTKRVKVIYPLNTANHAEGLGIEPGQTITNVEVAEHVIEQQQAQGELIITPSAKGDVAKVARAK